MSNYANVIQVNKIEINKKIKDSINVLTVQKSNFLGSNHSNRIFYFYLVACEPVKDFFLSKGNFNLKVLPVPKIEVTPIVP